MSCTCSRSSNILPGSRPTKQIRQDWIRSTWHLAPGHDQFSLSVNITLTASSVNHWSRGMRAIFAMCSQSISLWKRVNVVTDWVLIGTREMRALRIFRNQEARRWRIQSIHRSGSPFLTLNQMMARFYACVIAPILRSSVPLPVFPVLLCSKLLCPRLFQDYLNSQQRSSKWLMRMSE